MATETTHAISVIIPTLDEANHLGTLLEDIAEQSVQADEVIIIDGGSKDATRIIAKSNPKLKTRIFLNRQKRVPYALNIGLAAARGQLIIRIDAHARVNPKYIETIAKNFADKPNLGGVGGIKQAHGKTKTGQIIAKVLSSRVAVGGSAYHYAMESQYVDHIPFGAYPKFVLEQLSGWDETFLTNQDYELDYRIRQSGKKILLDPEAVITWNSRESVGKLFHQYHRYGQGKAAVVRKHPQSAKPRHLLPTILVLGLVTALTFSAFVSPWFALAPLPYLSLIWALTSKIPLLGLRQRLTAASAIAAMHTGYGSGFIRYSLASIFFRQPKISPSRM